MKSIKIRLELNNEKRNLAAQHAGTARYAYNWGLERSQKAYQTTSKRPTAVDLHKDWVIYKKTEATWAQSVSKCAPQEAFRHLNQAYQRAFKMAHVRLPKFKKKGQRDSFYLEGSIHLKGNRIKLPKLGWVKCSEMLPQGIVVKNVTVSRQGEHWFVLFQNSAF